MSKANRARWRLAVVVIATAAAFVAGVLVGGAAFALLLRFVITPFGLGSVVWGLVWSASMIGGGVTFAVLVYRWMRRWLGA